MADHDTTRDAPGHHTGTGKGEEKTGTHGKESGRHDHADTHADRPAGGSTMRDATGINPDDREPKDPSSPTFPPS